jgi:biopolymer transport protein ExbD
VALSTHDAMNTAGRGRRRRSRRASLSEINVTPLVDVMLVLLIIFMIAAPLSTINIPVDLPAVSGERTPRPDEPLVLTLKPDLSLTLDDDTVARDMLGTALDKATSGDKTRRVFLRADKTVSYGELMNLMNALRAAGYLHVALVALATDKAAP